MSDALIIALISSACSLAVAIIPKMMEKPNDFEKKLDDISKKIDQLTNDTKMNSDMIYNLLNHASTNNNTGGMKKCLDQYNEYFRR